MGKLIQFPRGRKPRKNHRGEPLSAEQLEEEMRKMGIRTIEEPPSDLQHPSRLR
ncbi:MAG TPA: hypothetical protein VLB73_01325 [Patescibacteria group bacterium]|nr:hypothetical protein [Patescibacteria group bacterium]